MAQTYNPRPDGFGGHGEQLGDCMAYCEDVGTKLLLRETLSYKGCEIETVTVSNRKGARGWVESFNLQDIDPQSIHVTQPTAGTDGVDVAFSARNDVEALRYPGKVPVKGVQSEFQMDNIDYALRFANAFKHAVELCGGKPSTF